MPLELLLAFVLKGTVWFGAAKFTSLKNLKKKMKQPKSDFFSRHVNTRQMLDQVASARSSISAIVALIHSFWLLLPRRLDSFLCFCVI